MRLAAFAVAGMAALAGSAGAAPAHPPDVPAIQAAYADAKADNADRHLDDLAIHSADCSPIDAGRFYCQISYLRAGDDAEGHLYFTVVTMEPGPGRWILKSGLCRGDGAAH
ncbi:MAG TPA: hypothetical protein VH722_05520 [Alphaproteobacteria bacterium]|jgi:hypothetical protein|nr:hypothetical protein [Alphaproteobacteria bacterium]